MEVLRNLSLTAMLLLSLTACISAPPTGTDVEAAKTKQATNDAALSVGYPSTPNKLTKKTLRLIYEQLDRGFDTFITYRQINTGNVRLICKGYGYPIPYSTQFTRPEEFEYRTDQAHVNPGWVKLPQAEPDGIYKGTSHSATYYLCKGQKGLHLEYEEQEIGATTQEKIWDGGVDKFVAEGEPLVTYAELETLKNAKDGDSVKAILDKVDKRLDDFNRKNNLP